MPGILGREQEKQRPGVGSSGARTVPLAQEKGSRLRHTGDMARSGLGVVCAARDDDGFWFVTETKHSKSMPPAHSCAGSRACFCVRPDSSLSLRVSGPSLFFHLISFCLSCFFFFFK